MKQGLYVDKRCMHRGEYGVCNAATGADEYLLNQDLHWLALRRDQISDSWYLHDNGEVQPIKDHKAYIEKFVAESDDNWAVPLRLSTINLTSPTCHHNLQN